MFPILFLTIGILVKGSIYAAVVVDAGVFENRPHAVFTQHNVEAVARIMLADDPYNLLGAKYKGTTLNIEVRSRDEKKLLWTSTVLFRPSGGGAVNLNTLDLVNAKIELRLCTRDDYFGPNHAYNYGTRVEEGKETRQEGHRFPGNIDNQFLISHEDIEKDRIERGEIIATANFHKSAFKTALFEFALPHAPTIIDLVAAIERVRRLPNNVLIQYTGSGYTSYTAQGIRGSKAYNCATFAMALLQDLGIPLCDHGSYLKQYINHEAHVNKTRAGTLLGGIIGGVAVYGGLISGPVGWGVLAGGVVLGFWADNKMSAAYPHHIYNELFKIRAQLPMQLVLLEGHRGETTNPPYGGDNHYTTMKNYESMDVLYPQFYQLMQGTATLYRL